MEPAKISGNRKSTVAKYLRRILDPIVIPVVMVVSGSFTYPFMGITYLALRPSLWGHLIGFVILNGILMGVVYIVMFVCLYPFHAIFGLALNGPSGLFTSGISLFFECSVVAGMLSNWLLLPGPLKSLFDSVLVKEGYHDLVLKGKLRRSLKLPWEIRMKQAIIANAKGIFLPLWIIKILIIFFLNFIPVLGPIFMVVIKGPKNGAVAHSAYFQMRGFNKKQRDTWIRRRKGAYIGFGITAGIFTSLPLLGILFNFSNCAGAALWAVEFERKRALVLSSTPESPTFQSQLKRVLGLDTQ